MNSNRQHITILVCDTKTAESPLLALCVQINAKRPDPPGLN